MKYLWITVIGACIVLVSCKDDVAPVPPGFEYHVNILSPDASTKHIGDTPQIDVEFESQTGMTLHHINIRITDKDTGTEIYNKPDEAHVHQESGMYEFTDDFVLSAANGVTESADYVLEAQVWSDEDGVDEVTESVEFHFDS